MSCDRPVSITQIVRAILLPLLGIGILSLVAQQSLALHTGQYHRSEVTAIRFDPSGRFIAIGRISGRIGIWDRRDDKWLWEAAGAQYSHPISEVFFIEDGKRLIAFKRHNRLKVYDSLTGQLVRNTRLSASIDEKEIGFYAVAVDASHNILAISGFPTAELIPYLVLVDLDIVLDSNQEGAVGELVELDLSGTSENRGTDVQGIFHLDYQSVQHIGHILSLKFCGPTPYLVVTTSSGYLAVWKLDRLVEGRTDVVPSGESRPYYLRQVGSPRLPYRPVEMVSCYGSSNFVTTGFDTNLGPVQNWDIQGKHMQPALIGKDAPRHAVWYLIDIDRMGNYVITRGLKKYIFWKLANNELIPTGWINYTDLHYPATSKSFGNFHHDTVAFSPDSQLVAVAMNWNVFVIDPATLSVKEEIGLVVEPLYPDLF